MSDKVHCQLTAQFKLDAPTTSTYTRDSVSNTRPDWYLDSNSFFVTGYNARQVGNGILAQGNTFACTRPTTPTTVKNLDASSDFTITYWIYDNDPKVSTMYLSKVYVRILNH